MVRNWIVGNLVASSLSAFDHLATDLPLLNG
jgi:hypothetical protein